MRVLQTLALPLGDGAPGNKIIQVLSCVGATKLPQHLPLRKTALKLETHQPAILAVGLETHEAELGT
jgi:hypothetical protein